MSSLEKSVDALSDRIISVRLHVKRLFLATKDFLWAYVSLGLPHPTALSSMSPACTITVIFASSLRASFLKSSLKSAAPFEALTAMMQSPRLVRVFSVVISNVFTFFPVTFGWPQASNASTTLI